MDKHNLSESEQMYLVTLARMLENGHREPVPLTALAEAMGVQPVSVNQMVRRLTQQGYLEYIPYKGARFAPPGQNLARQILRFRRLWAVFLTEKLGYAPQRADELACSLEHITTPALSDRLAAFLGHPRTDPQGKAIPSTEALSPPLNAVPLNTLKTGTTAQVAEIPSERGVRVFLQGEGLTPGARLHLQGEGETSLLVRVAQNSVFISQDLASQIFVIPTQE